MARRAGDVSVLRRTLKKEFNKYIRNRDRLKGCISCFTGKVEQAGHYYSVGANPQPAMQFCELNVHGQCIHCNYTLAGNLKGYRKGLLRRYGPDVLMTLEVKKSVKQNPWGKFEYEQMIKMYKRKNKEFENVK